MAPFAMVAKYLLGGLYTIQMGDNVRMDLFYGEWSERKKSQIDTITVLINQYGLNEIWDAEYSTVGVKHISADSWHSCHFATKVPINSLDDLKGKRVFTFPTAGRFLALRLKPAARSTEICEKGSPVGGSPCETSLTTNGISGGDASAPRPAYAPGFRHSAVVSSACAMQEARDSVGSLTSPRFSSFASLRPRFTALRVAPRSAIPCPAMS
ncbi:hypothetical protein SAMN04488026_101428 [Aliiruegeria lutimaris]|uniref:Uncharacterized protein n=1 Tax=Aliiruegeria lutimaris TaxID=571298 RepID=A0A1G8S0E6_9RHOB|nr:hypothetical protein SAMN04488026_101428 [Aliiruegeria lutimaris]